MRSSRSASSADQARQDLAPVCEWKQMAFTWIDFQGAVRNVSVEIFPGRRRHQPIVSPIPEMCDRRDVLRSKAPGICKQQFHLQSLSSAALAHGFNRTLKYCLSYGRIVEQPTV